MKIRILNARHQVLANAGKLLSQTTIADCMTHLAPEIALHIFCHAVPDHWYQMWVILSATGSFNRLAQISGKQAAELGTRLIPPGTANFLPYLSGERTPHNDAIIRGAFTGLSATSGLDDLTRAHTDPGRYARPSAGSIGPVFWRYQPCLRSLCRCRAVMIDPNIRATFIKDINRYRTRLDRMVGQPDIAKVSGEGLNWLLTDPLSLGEKVTILLERGPRC